MCIVNDGNVANVEDGCWDGVTPIVFVLAALWILNPKINNDVPIKKETIARIFPVIAGMITIGYSWLICSSSGGCCDCDYLMS